MKITSFTTVLALGASLAVFAQDVPPPSGDAQTPPPPPAGEPGQRGPRGQRGQRFNQQRPQRDGFMGGDASMAADMESRMFVRMITRPNVAKELGISDETVTEINDSFLDIDVRSTALTEELNKAAKEQADLLKATPLNEEAVMAAVDKVWDIRKQLATLQTKKLIVVLTTLTPEQTAKAREMMQNRGPAAWGNRGNRPQRGPATPQPPAAPAAPEASAAPEAK